MVNYRTLNNKLLTRINKAKSKQAKLNIMNKIFGAYQNKMAKNSRSFFKLRTKSADDFNKYTLNTIKNKITDSILKDTFDVDTLKKQLNRIVNKSREFQKQKNIINIDVEKFKKNDTETKYIYIITHPTKNNSVSDHDPQCYADNQKRIFTQKEMIETSKELPRHNYCSCHFEVIKKG